MPFSEKAVCRGTRKRQILSMRWNLMSIAGASFAYTAGTQAAGFASLSLIGGLAA